MLSVHRHSENLGSFDESLPISKKPRLDDGSSKTNTARLTLPHDLWVKIFSMLDLGTLQAVICVNKEFHSIVRNYKQIFINPDRNILFDALENAIINKSALTIHFLAINAVLDLEKYPTFPLLQQLVSGIRQEYDQSKIPPSPLDIADKNRLTRHFMGRFPVCVDGKGILIEAIKRKDRALIKACLDNQGCEPLTQEQLEMVVKSQDNDIFRAVFHSVRTDRNLPPSFFKYVCEYGTVEMLRELMHSYCGMNFIEEVTHKNINAIFSILSILYQEKKWDHLNEILYLPQILDQCISVQEKDKRHIYTCFFSHSSLFAHAAFIRKCGYGMSDKWMHQKKELLKNINSEYEKIQRSDKKITQEDLNRALILACYSGIPSVVNYLLKKGAQLEDRDFLAIKWAMMRNIDVVDNFFKNWEKYNIPTHVLEACCYLHVGRGIGWHIDNLIEKINHVFNREDEKQRFVYSKIIQKMFTESMTSGSTVIYSGTLDLWEFLSENILCVNEMRLFPLKQSIMSNTYRGVTEYFKQIGENKLKYNAEYHKEFLAYFINYCDDENILRLYLAYHIFYINFGPQGYIKSDEEHNLQIENTITEIKQLLGSAASDNDQVRKNLEIVDECEAKLDQLIMYFKQHYPILNSDTRERLHKETEQFRALFVLQNKLMVQNSGACHLFNILRLLGDPVDLGRIVAHSFEEMRNLIHEMNNDLSSKRDMISLTLWLGTPPNHFEPDL